MDVGEELRSDETIDADCRDCPTHLRYGADVISHSRHTGHREYRAIVGTFTFIQC